MKNPVQKKKIIISVVSDLVTDQRVHRTAITLHDMGHTVLLIGRKKKNSENISRPYGVRRFQLWWEKGPWFYASYNLRLFFYLLFHKADLLIANDLDTLLPNYLISRLKRIPLYYDSHEYFTEVPELVNRPVIQKTWKFIERWIMPRLKLVSTVNDSIAEMYKAEYGISLSVIRNVPITRSDIEPKSRKDLGLEENKPVLLFQGAGINMHRGGEEAIEAMQFLPDCKLLIIGSGDLIDQLIEYAKSLRVDDRVLFLPKMPFDLLRAYTATADIGLSLDKDTNLNYRYSLPNKIFDYIHAQLPVIVSNLVEPKKIITTYKVGLVLEQHSAKQLAETVKQMLSDPHQLKLWKSNTIKAAQELCWEKENLKLIDLLKHVV